MCVDWTKAHWSAFGHFAFEVYQFEIFLFDFFFRVISLPVVDNKMIVQFKVVQSKWNAKCRVCVCVNDAKYTLCFSGGIHIGIYEMSSQKCIGKRHRATRSARNKKRIKITKTYSWRKIQSDWERRKDTDVDYYVDVVCTSERERNVLHVPKQLSVRFKFLDYACV